MNNQVQLITYVNRFGGDTLADLHALLKGPLAGLFGGVHLLPFFYPIDGSDAGFDPIDHTQVDPRLGDWGDIAALAADVPVMADVIVNHMSSDSPQFQDYSQRAGQSEFSGLFLTMDAVFPDGASEKELLNIYRPRPGLPFTSTKLASGEHRLLWITFTSKQVDINVTHPKGMAYLDSILRQLASSGVTMIRLDAVGYAIKKPGTSCFMLPETFEFIDEFSARARQLGLEVLVEIHSYYRRQIEIAKRVDWVYDFALPALVLHAIFFGTACPLNRWIRLRPTNALTVLDTHDGIGIIDIGSDARDRTACPGLVPDEDLDILVDLIHQRSGAQSRQATGVAASNLDIYQVNCTFYDALGRNDQAYLVARAIQFFLPGIPQVYYVGLLAGENDMDLLARTGVGRDINRHYFDRAEVLERLHQPVVQDLLQLIRLRNSHPAFQGSFELVSDSDVELIMRWTQAEHHAQLFVNLKNLDARLGLSGEQGFEPWAMRSAVPECSHLKS
jgi:sucrose phosphorylase